MIDYFRSETYRRAVATLPCARCGLEQHSQAAHSNSHRHGKGGALKAEDTALFPLCVDRPFQIGCHTKHDRLLDYDREEAERRELEWIIWTYAQLLRLGVLIVDTRKIPKP